MDYTLDLALGDLAELVQQRFDSTEQHSVAAALKPLLQKKSQGRFSELKFGFASFRDFLNEARRRGLVQLDDGKYDTLVFPPGTAPSSVSRVIKRRPRVRSDLWRAFTDWTPDLERLYDKETNRAFSISPDGTSEPPMPPDVENRSKDTPEDFLLITPVTRSTQLEWMKAFVESLEDRDLASLLSISLQAERPAHNFMAFIRTNPSAHSAWKETLREGVEQAIRAWLDTNEVGVSPYDVPSSVSDQASKRPRVAANADDKNIGDVARRMVIGAVERMPVNELLRLRIPLEYLLSSGDE